MRYRASVVSLSLAALLAAGATAQSQSIEDVVWTGAVGVSVSGNSLTKTGGAGWNAGATSTRVIESSGFAEFTATETNTNRSCGLSKGSAGQGEAEIDFAIRLTSSAGVSVYESGSLRGSFGTYAAGDRFRVEAGHGVVRYRKNGAVFYTSTVVPDFPLLVDSSLDTTSATLTNVRMGNLGWVRDTNVTVSGTSLTKTGTAGWNAGAITTKSIAYGDGYVDFAAVETNTDRRAGLSYADSGLDPADIDFGIDLKADNTFGVVEAGLSRGSFGTYVSGDRFKVEVQGGTVRYLQNGSLFYTSALAPQYPLVVDTALNQTGATVSDIRVSNLLWSNPTGVTASEGTLTNTGSASWVSGAVSTASAASGSAFVEFTATETNTGRMCGLGTGDTGYHYSDIEFAISLGSTGTVSVYESGTLIGSYGSYVAGDRFRVEVAGAVVKYRKNGLVFYTSAASPTYPLLVDTSFDHIGGTLSNVTLGRFVWTSDAGGYVWGSGFVKTAATTWANAGAASAQTVASGEAFAEIVASEGSTYRMAGLSSGNTDNNYTDIDFAVYLQAGSSAQVYESGTPKGSAIAYAAGDRFRVEAVSGVVRYRKNGVIFYTSAVAPTYPLLVDSALYSTGATLADLTLGAAADVKKVAPLAFSPPSATNSASAVTVTIATTTSGAEIRYTTDGTEPIETSTLYTGSMSVGTATNFKAKGFKSGMIPSDTATAAYTFNYGTLTAPTMSPVAGSYTSSVEVTLTGPSGATIRYTTDGADPTASSAVYTAPLYLSITTTLKAKAFHVDWTQSATASTAYTILVATPTFTPDAGSYAAGQTITVSTGTAGATIRYTMNGVDPTATDPTIASGGTLVVGNFTLKAKAFKAGCTDSGVKSASYTMTGTFTPGALAAGNSHMLAVQSDGTVWASGYDYFGELGDGAAPSGDYRWWVDRVAGLTGVTAVEAGTSTSVALRSDGTVWTWGSNASGQLGDGTPPVSRTLPSPIGLSGVVSIDAGESHMVAAKSDGTVWAWGSNSNGQIGDGTTTQRNTPTQVPSLANVVAVKAGRFHSLALKSDGTVWSWGLNALSQLGDGTALERHSPVQVDGLTSITAIAAGTQHSLALRSDGSVWGWGANGLGEIGDNAFITQRYTPSRTYGLTGVTAITAGNAHSAAIKSDGTLWAWGVGNELGYGATANSKVPVQVVGLSSAIRVAAGHAITSDGSVWGWGANSLGTVGDGTNLTRLVPVRASDPAFFWKAATPTYGTAAGVYYVNQNVAVSSSMPAVTIRYTTNGAEPTESDTVVASGSTVLVDRNLTLKAKAWKTGRAPSNVDAPVYALKATTPTFNPLGGTFTSAPSVTISTTTSGATLRYTTNGSEPTASSTLYSGPVVISTNTTLKAKAFKTDWTESDTQTATYTMSFGAAAAPGMSPAAGTYTGSVEVSLSGPAGATVRYTTDGSEPTTGSTAYSAPFTLTTTTTVKAKSHHPDYALSATTSNAYTIQVAAPALSPGTGTYAAGQDVTVTVATPGATIRYTLNGVDPTANDAPIASGSTLHLLKSLTLKAKAFKTGCTDSPVTAATYTVTGEISQGRVFAGASHSLVLKPDGSVWVWGANSSSQLGDGTNVQKEYPINIAGLTTSTALAGGGSHSLAVRSGATMQSAGANSLGQLGDGTTTPRNTFTTASSLSGVTAVAAGQYHSLAVKSDGTAWGAGSNANGQLGIGSADGNAHATPAQVTNLTGTVTAAAAGVSHSLVLKSDGTVYGFGYNTPGQVGDGTTTQRTAPVAVTGLSGVVTAIAAGDNHSLALKSDGTVWGWGRNDYGGALGDGTTTNRTSPVQAVGIDGVVAISAGSVHSLALKSDGTVWAWGNSNWHQLGDGSGNSSNRPIQVPGLPGIVAIAAGATHNLVIAEDGSVWAWGANGNGQIGDGTILIRPTPVKVSDASFLWKACTPTFNPAGGLSFASTTVTLSCTTPGVAIHYTTSGADPTTSDPSVSSGGTVVVGETLTLKARGFKTALASSNLASAVYTLQVVTPVFSPPAATYGTPPDVMISTTTPGASLRYTTDGSEPTESSALYSAPFAVSVTTTLKAKGFKSGWTASATASATYTLKVATAGLSPGGGSHTGAQTVTVTCATPGAVVRYSTSGLEPTESSPVVTSGGTLLIDRSLTLMVKGWKTGWTTSDTLNATYRINLGTVATPTLSPVAGTYGSAQSVSLATATAGATIRYTLDGSEPIWASPTYTGPITIDWTATVKARAFLADSTGSLTGTAAYTITSSAVAPATYAPPPGSYTTYQRVVLTTGTSGAVVRYTTNGADPTETDPVSPVEGVLVDRSLVLKARAFKSGMTASPIRRGGYQITGAVASGYAHALVLKTDGTVWAFGNNYTGQLGNGTTAASDTPVQVSVVTDIVAVATGMDGNGVNGSNHGLAVKRDGTVWAWGNNSNGQIGDGTTTQRTTPVQVTGLTGVFVTVAAGDFHSLALKGDGTVWAWGSNQSGCLGDNTTTQRPTPVQTNGLTDVAAIAAGRYVSWALKRDGTVWGWGYNFYGMVGDGSTTDRWTPTQVSGLTGVTAIAGATWHAVALKTDGAPTGTAWGWGYTGYGLGDGTTATRTTPVQILSEVTAVAAGTNQTLFLRREAAGPPSVWGAGVHYANRLDQGASGTTQTPVRIATGPFLGLAAGTTISLALRRDTTILTWDQVAMPGRGNGLGLGTAGATDDPDGDGLSTSEEWSLGSDPWNADTNGDGIPDGAARATGKSTTNLDMDGDGVLNAAEVAQGTDPFNADTDGDAVGDAADCFPLDPTRSQCPAPNPGDTTPPVITLTEPTNASLISSVP